MLVKFKFNLKSLFVLITYTSFILLGYNIYSTCKTQGIYDTWKLPKLKYNEEAYLYIGNNEVFIDFYIEHPRGPKLETFRYYKNGPQYTSTTDHVFLSIIHMERVYLPSLKTEIMFNPALHFIPKAKE